MKPHHTLYRRCIATSLRFIFCAFLLIIGQIAYATPTTPTSDFIDNGDGTVTHKLTGLIWQRCAVGQTWTGSDCSGEAKTFTYAEAMALKSDFAGQSDWRVPNIAELQTIVEWGNISPAINTTIFPDTPSTRFWSSTLYPANDGKFNIDFNYGDTGAQLSWASNVVRLVRTGQLSGIDPSSPNSDFSDNQDGTVTHKRTGLIWQRCSVGQTWTGKTCSGSAKKYTYDAALTLTSNFASHTDWRMPSIDELASITNYYGFNPAINTVQFPHMPPYGDFWSSTSYVGDANYTWNVEYDGTVRTMLKKYYKQQMNRLSVRFVRTGQPISTLSLPDGDIGGDKKGWIPLLQFGDPMSSYIGVTAYMNDLNGVDDYQCAELAFRFAKDALHLKRNVKPNQKPVNKPTKADGIRFAEANKDEIGYVELNGKKIDIVARYYPRGSSTPPVNGSIISQTSVKSVGHVSIAKKIDKIDDNTLDVYLFEQNWIWQQTIADSRKMHFIRNPKTGEWTGGTPKNKATGWLNPEVK